MSHSASKKKSRAAQSKQTNNPSTINEAQPSLGDISALQSEIKNAKSNSQNIGDMENVATDAANEVLGDITLLEEAFAEMEVSVADYEQEIPMLHSAIEQPSTISQVEPPTTKTDIDESIPVLDQAPTEFSEEAATNPESIHIGTNPAVDAAIDIPTLEPNSNLTEQNEVSVISSIIPDSEPAESSIPQQAENTDEVISEVVAPNSEPSQIDLPAAEPSEILIAEEKPATQPETPSNTSFQPSSIAVPQNEAARDSHESDMASSDISTPCLQTETTTTNFSETASDEEPAQISETVPPAISSLLVEPASEPVPPITEAPETKASAENSANDASPSRSIEAEIAQATSDNEPSKIDSEMDKLEEQINTELAPSIIEEMVTSQITTPGGDVNMSIPFELHAQLSKKIDALVLDATVSLTSELENQLSQQLETLLGNAVEAVLPRLVDQMVSELRSEVNGRVRQQLPLMVNEVLGKTRLT